MIISIDGGVGGAMVALPDYAGGPPVAMCAMPTVRREGVKEVDAVGAVDWILGQAQAAQLAVLLEALPHHSMNKSAMRSMGLNFGLMLGALRMKRLDPVLIPAGNLLGSWQRILGKVPAGGTKPAALALARHLWPCHSWALGGRGVHDGAVDAAIMGEFYRRRANAA